MGINWSEIFYPDNEKKREEIHRLAGELFYLLQRCCDATNRLIEAVERHLPGKNFSKVSIDKDKTIKTNCNAIKERLHEIEEYMEQHRLDVKDRMNPELFEKLNSIDLSFLDKLDIVKKVSTGSMSIGYSAGALFLVGAIRTGLVLTSLAASVGTLGACAISTVVVTVIFLGIDMIIGAITGAIERDQLDAALSEYKQAVDTFKPASEMFYDNISEVRVILESL